MNSILLRLPETAMQSSLLIAVVLLLRGAFGDRLDRRLRYYLWLPVILHLLLPAAVGSRLSVMNLLPKAAPAVVPDAAAAVSLSETSQSVQQAVTRPFPWAAVLLCIWLAGAAATALFELIGCVRFIDRLRRSREEVSIPALSELCVQLSIRRVPKVYITDQAVSPCAVGVLRSSIYLPSWALSDEERLRYILMHELMHIRHRDNLISLLLSVCCAVYWFDPLVWLMDYYSHRDRELACDAWVTAGMTGDERTAYGMALISAVRMQSVSSRRVFAPTFAAPKNDMFTRLRSIRKNRRSSKWLNILVCSIMICALAAFGTSAKSSVTQTAEEAEFRVMVNVQTLSDSELAQRLIDSLTPCKCWTECETDSLEYSPDDTYIYITKTDRLNNAGQIYEVVVDNEKAYVYYNQLPYGSAERKCIRMSDAAFDNFTEIFGSVTDYLYSQN